MAFMEARELLHFLKEHRLAVEASVSPCSSAQAAVVGFAISDTFEIIFDTLDSTRKMANIRCNPVSFPARRLESVDLNFVLAPKSQFCLRSDLNRCLRTIRPKR